MQEAFVITLGKMVEILGLLLIGFFMRKWNLLPEQTPKVMSGLSAKLFLPCLTLYSNIEKCTVQNLSENANLVLYGLLFTVISVGLAYLLAPVFEREDIALKRQYRYSVAIPNTGAAALPLALELFGLNGVFQLGLFLLVNSIFTYSWGMVQLIPQKGNGLKSFLRRLCNPVMVALASGMVLGLLGGSEWIPEAALSLMSDLSDCYVPASLMLVGYAIAGFDLGKLLKSAKIYAFTALRLLGLPFLFLGLCLALNAPATVMLLAAIVYAGPCGMNPIVFGAEYGTDTEQASGLLLVTMILCVITLPLVYAVAIWVTGG